MESHKLAGTSPHHQTERPLQTRTRENDTKALKAAKDALEYIEERRDRFNPGRKGKEASNSPNIDQEVGEDVHDQPQSTFLGSVSAVMLPLKSLDDSKRNNPKKKDLVTGAKQFPWSNIGFPADQSLCVKGFEDETNIDIQEPSIASLAQDILDIKNKSPAEIADGDITVEAKDQRKIERFTLNGRTVVKIKFKEADVYSKKSTYKELETCKEFEKQVSKGLGDQPCLEIEQYVAAQVLLCLAGKIGGKTEAYWRTARDLAQKQLYLNPELEETVREQLREEKDPALEKMLEMVKKGILIKAFNPYNQAQRDEYAIKHKIFYHVKSAEIVMVLDNADQVIAFQFSDTFNTLLTKQIERKVLDAFETYSTLQPVPVPDATRHGLHWVDWLRERPELDFRNPDNDPRMAKSGVYHFGARCTIGDPHGSNGPRSTQDSSVSGDRLKGAPYVSQQLEKLRYSALGACTEVIRFFFNILDADLLEKYQDVAREVENLGGIPFQTRRSGDPFLVKALLVNLMTTEHKDSKDWEHGFACLVPVGDFTGGDLLFRELGLQIEAPAGCVQFMRGRELVHSISKWKGRRFVVVSVTHDAVKQWAQKRIRDREAADDASGAKPEASQGDILHIRKASRKGTKRTLISSDSSSEESEDKPPGAKRKKSKKAKNSDHVEAVN